MFKLQTIRRAWRAYIAHRNAVLHDEFCQRIALRSKRELQANKIRSQRAYRKHGYNPRRAVWSRPRWTTNYGWMVSYDEYWFQRKK